MNQIEIGRFIATLRKEQNMTQKCLAEMLGVTDRAISKWENGRGLPDVLLMKNLCSIFNISIDELLNAKRAENSERNENNVLNVLLEREREFRKRKRLQIVCAILLAITIISVLVSGFVTSGKIISSIRGEGSSFYTDYYSKKAEIVARCVVDENFEKAVKYIGFLGQNKTETQQEWKENMEELYESVEIEDFDITKIVLDDYFPSGKYYITVYDLKTGVRYILDGQITIQDKGIAFGKVYISNEATESRINEIALMVENALCTWNAG